MRTASTQKKRLKTEMITFAAIHNAKILFEAKIELSINSLFLTAYSQC